ncbi:MAG: glycosyltransferase family 4 protein [Cyanomargarita calcarea GSE-NOS-MK-12-04C]|jgi:UDP-glucose:tetrahydrobiopterin glucosyltransferase|uniref:Glycosyltransferase family 4 protein n=1 Tax=Cyanomargarita calcarea GSE-NOS-MK-12-04C TaxID=2839659 RepID=A0A951QNP3_9CYAN|nr:glycosyltransferase family 4 protein [Cyanomargarita calcarea GSE-NOS-MK-12-04C]
MNAKPLKLLFISTPVGSLGTGLGGGVELSLYNIAQEMNRRGHLLQIVAPVGSTWNMPLIQIPGNLQIIAQSQQRTDPVTMPENSVLANMWEYARQVQNDFDLIVNFAYDWLPFYLTPFFKCPIAHLVSMGSLLDALDQILVQVSKQFPGTIGFHTHQQAVTFPELTPPIHYLSNGIDLSIYQFCAQPKQQLGWIGRISPEKGLEDAFAVAKSTGISLKIMGKIQDELYWQQITQDYPNTPFEYLGFLSTAEMQQILRDCQGLLMTPRWVEAFGNVTIESLACGVPVISYRRGGPAEIIQDGKTGFLVEPDSVAGLVEATQRLNEIDRYTCRAWAETEYSLTALGSRFEQWFEEILNSKF